MDIVHVAYLAFNKEKLKIAWEQRYTVELTARNVQVHFFRHPCEGRGLDVKHEHQLSGFLFSPTFSPKSFVIKEFRNIWPLCLCLYVYVCDWLKGSKL